MKDHRLGALKYCAVGLGFSRLIVGRISCSLHLCGHLLSVKHKCPVVALFTATAFVCILRPFIQGLFRQRPFIQGLFRQPFVLVMRTFCIYVYFSTLFVTVFVAYTLFFSRAQFWRRQYWRILGHTDTEEFRTQAVPPSIYRDEHGGYRLFISARAVVVSETYPLFTIHVSCLSVNTPALQSHCSELMYPPYGILPYPDIPRPSLLDHSAYCTENHGY